MNIFISLPIILLFLNYFITAFGNEVNLTKFADSLQRFNFSYPLDWKIQYENNDDLFFFPLNTTKYNNTLACQFHH